MKRATAVGREWVAMGATEPVDLPVTLDEGVLTVTVPKAVDKTANVSPALLRGLRNYGWVVRPSLPNVPRIDVESTEMTRVLEVLGFSPDPEAE